MTKPEKIVEYEIIYKDGDVDHIGWRAARMMMLQPPDDVDLIVRITRYGDDASGDLRRDEEILYDKSPKVETGS